MEQVASDPIDGRPGSRRREYRLSQHDQQRPEASALYFTIVATISSSQDAASAIATSRNARITGADPTRAGAVAVAEFGWLGMRQPGRG